MKFILIKRSYFCVLHPLLGPQIKFINFLENQPTLLSMLVMDKIFNSGMEEMEVLMNGRGPVHLFAPGADCRLKHGQGHG